MTRIAGRQRLLTMVQEAVTAGARLSEACRCVGLSERTLQRWQQVPDDRRASTRRPAPKNKLSAEEEQQVLTICLKITASHSRPRVSNDNAHVGSLFRTLKYVPSWPEKGFATLEDARVGRNLRRLVQRKTSAQRHRGEDHMLLARRKSVYEAAKMQNPYRWSGATRNWSRQDEVWLNPERETLAA